MEKVCKECGVLKPYTAYNKNYVKIGEVLHVCKACLNIRAKTYRQNNLEKWREYDRARAFLPHRVEARRKNQKRWTTDPELKKLHQTRTKEWQLKNTEKRAAHVLVGNYLRDGKIIKKPCERCGSEHSEAHHDDYSKPLEIMWLCKTHHGHRHRELNAIKRLSGQSTIIND